MSVATRKKRVSKKNKSAWRKHTDIKDVEQFLEDQRQEERIGTFSEKKDEELFTIDTAPVKKLLVSESVKRKANAKKPPKGFMALENTSMVSDPIVKRNHVKPKKNGRNIEAEIRNPTTQIHVQANKDRRKYNEKLDRQLMKDKTAKEFKEDLWAEKDILADYPALKSHWVSKPLALYTLRNIGKGVTKIHDSIRHKTTKASKFEPPHPGMSYNPSLKDHKDLIDKVLSKEENIIKEENHLKRVTTQMFTKMSVDDRDMAVLTELASGLPVEDGGSGGSEDEEQNVVTESNDDSKPYDSVNPPALNKKKDRKARRKQKEQKILKTEKIMEKTAKQRVADLNRLNKLKDEVVIEEQQLTILKKHRKRVHEKKKLDTKRLGKLKFKEADIEVNMVDDIAGNLRNVKPESNLLVDRFKNFQKRNILPTSVDLGTRKRRKIKRFVRSSHKEPQLPIPKKK